MLTVHKKIVTYKSNSIDSINLNPKTNLKIMKKIHFIGAAALMLLVFASTTSCNKKKGNCYCTFYSGDKTHYDLTALSRSDQQDSCNVINNNASNFAGSCKLK